VKENDIELQEAKDFGGDNRNPTQVLEVDMSKFKIKKKDEVSRSEEEVLAEFNNVNFLVLSVRNFQKSSLWFSIIIAFLAMRGASGWSCLLAYASVVCRII
jgi:hypothetical protein